MSFDLTSLQAAVATHGQVARVVVADVQGSAPREIGASMLVWSGGQSGTIGGGALELDASKNAFADRDRLDRVALGPALGQCCGGSVTLLTEIWTQKRLNDLPDGPIVRRVEGTSDVPLAIKAATKAARSGDDLIKPTLVSGWMIEPVSKATRDIWIYGAGHVGRALVSVLAPMPEFALTWVDSSADRFPEKIDGRISCLVAGNPADVVQYAPADAEHLVLTYSHAIDLDICHRALSHGARSIGLIGSATKWARFRRRLTALGHGQADLSRIQCPIGLPALGKHPQAIAIGVASEMISSAETLQFAKIQVG